MNGLLGQFKWVKSYTMLKGNLITIEEKENPKPFISKRRGPRFKIRFFLKEIKKQQMEIFDLTNVAGRKQ
jgi:hypothetical protein